MKLKEWIERSELTQADLARILGMNRSYLNLVVNEKKVPGRDLAQQIETFTNGQVTARELLRL